ncbi:MAG TPA: carbohydrate ABC transporter permease [Actinomycetales bacterium]|jgi:alpha-glucoside transport system permease protein
MSTAATTPVAPATRPSVSKVAVRASNDAGKRLSSPWASLAAVILAVLWTLPTLGLLISSIRPERAARTTGWWTFFSDPVVTLDNYRTVLSSEGSAGLGQYVVNSFVIVVPAVLIPICLALLASYALAWIEFPGRKILFIAIFALQIVPIQVTILPLLTLYVEAGLSPFWRIWLSHSIFALPLAIFLMHNFMKEIPKELIEAARVDGAGHVKIFFSVLMPLLKPAIAAFGIFQFLWVWNDLLVALTLGGAEVAPITVGVLNLSGTRDNAWHLLSAGAFVSIAVPVIVFLSLQRFFVRGLLAGGLKG